MKFLDNSKILSHFFWTKSHRLWLKTLEESDDILNQLVDAL